MKESGADIHIPSLIPRAIIALGYLTITISLFFVKRVEPRDAILLFLFGFTLLIAACSNRLSALPVRLTFAVAIVFAYALGRRAWIVERFVPTESAWQLLSFAGLFALLLVALWLPHGRAAWRRDERRDVLTVMAATSALLVLLSLVMLIMLIRKYPPPQFNPAQTLSVCTQSLEYLGIFAVAFFPPMEAKQWRWTAVIVSLLLILTAALSLRASGE